MVRVFSLMFLFLFLLSCKKDEHKLLSLDMSFVKMQENYKKDINDLKLQNSNQLKEINLNSIIDIDNFSDRYFNYLDSIQKLCNNKEYNPFFHKEKWGGITETGNEFIKRTNIYLKELNKNTMISQFLKERANHLLNVEDFKFDEERYTVHLEYYFRNVDCGVFIFLIESRKRDVLMIENQILYEVLLNQYKKEYIINGNTLK